MGKLAIFICGLLLGAIGAFGAVVYQDMYKKSEKDSIELGYKDFYDNKDYWVSISGTLTGEDMANNTYGVLCIKEQNTCFISYVNQIGSNPPRTGRIDTYTIPIVKWTNYEVIAKEEDYSGASALQLRLIAAKKHSYGWTNPSIKQNRTARMRGQPSENSALRTHPR
jgi:hypothetical protein